MGAVKKLIDEMVNGVRDHAKDNAEWRNIDRLTDDDLEEFILSQNCRSVSDAIQQVGLIVTTACSLRDTDAL